MRNPCDQCSPTQQQFCHSYQHNWHYYTGHWRERKIAPGTWKFRYTATKGRVKPTDSYGSLKRGARVTWHIHATQRVVKTDRNHYRTVMTGQKRLVRARQR